MPADFDAVIVGGSFAGLAAATYLARARRRVCVVDAGQPRNRFAARSHGFLSRDGHAPAAILAEARQQLAAYDTVDFVAGQAIAAAGSDAGFSLGLADGVALRSRLLLLAFGLHDDLPALPGLAERWGQSVLHCPYCHGFEFAGRRLGVLYRTPMSVHQAMLVAEWGPLTLFLNGHALTAEETAGLAARQISVEPAPVQQLCGGDDGSLAALLLADGRMVAVEALFVAPQSRLASPLAEQLGCAIVESPLGPMIQTDTLRMTTIPGLFAAGDIARAPHSVSWAVADGVTAGTAMHRALVFG